eukprot:scaffold1190_cov187-Ochromonas_danica.AAC.6
MQCLSFLGEKVPYTVVLFILGTLFSLADNAHGITFGESVSEWVNIDADLMLFVFLPPLIFGEAMYLNWYYFKGGLVQSFLLAGPGVLIGAALMGVFIKLVLPYDWPWNLSMLLGSILSATDTVAMVALLKSVGASPKLTILIVVYTAQSILSYIFATVLGSLALGAVRAITIAILYPAVSTIGHRCTPKEAIFMSWAGLRGALGMALALIVEHNCPDDIHDQTSRLFFYVGGIAALTLLINATTAKSVLLALGLVTADSPEKALVTSQIKKKLKKRTDRFIGEMTKEFELTPADIEEVRMSCTLLHMDDLDELLLRDTTIQNDDSSPERISQLLADQHQCYSPGGGGGGRGRGSYRHLSTGSRTSGKMDEFDPSTGQRHRSLSRSFRSAMQSTDEESDIHHLHYYGAGEGQERDSHGDDSTSSSTHPSTESRLPCPEEVMVIQESKRAVCEAKAYLTNMNTETLGAIKAKQVARVVLAKQAELVQQMVHEGLLPSKYAEEFLSEISHDTQRIEKERNRMYRQHRQKKEKEVQAELEERESLLGPGRYTIFSMIPFRFSGRSSSRASKEAIDPLLEDEVA